MALITIRPRTPRTGFGHMISLQIKPQFLTYMGWSQETAIIFKLTSVNVLMKFHDEITKIVSVLASEIK